MDKICTNCNFIYNFFSNSISYIIHTFHIISKITASSNRRMGKNNFSKLKFFLELNSKNFFLFFIKLAMAAAFTGAAAANVRMDFYDVRTSFLIVLVFGTVVSIVIFVLGCENMLPVTLFVCIIIFFLIS